MAERESEPNQQKLRDSKELFKQSGVVGLGRFGNLFLRYIQAIVVARMLGAADFGLYILARNTAQVFSLVGSFGLGPTLTRIIPVNIKDPSAVKRITRYSILISLVFSLSLALALIPLSKWLAVYVFKQPELREILVWFCLAIPIQSLIHVAYGILRGHKRIATRVVAENIIFPISSIILIAIFALLGLGVFSVVFAYIIAYAFTLIFSSYFINQINGVLSNWRIIGAAHEAEKKEVNTMAVPLLLSSSLSFVQKWTDTFMLGALSTVSAVGIYAVSLRVGAFIQIPLTALNMIFAPMIAEISATGDKQRLAANYKLVTRTVLLLSIPIFSLILLLSNELLYMFGEEFVDGGTALILICFGQLVNVSAGSTGQMLIMTGRARLHMYNSMAFLTLTIGLNWMLIPDYGIIGAAIANTVTLGTMNIMRLIQIYSYSRVHPFSFGFFKALIVGAISTSVVLFLRLVVPLEGPILRVAALGGLFVATYGLLTITAGLDAEEKMLLEKVLKKVRKKVR
jgi:O-antigen/teichoic acid export membrane protein